MKIDKSGFLKQINELSKFRQKLPHKIGVEAVKFYKNRFVVKGWDRDGDWKPTKKKNNKGSTLIDSGRLKRSIRKTRMTRDSVSIGSDVEYAKIHNEGGTVMTRNKRGRKSNANPTKRKTWKMPKRQFMGQHPKLDLNIRLMAYKEIKNIIR